MDFVRSFAESFSDTVSSESQILVVIVLFWKNGNILLYQEVIAWDTFANPSRT